MNTGSNSKPKGYKVMFLPEFYRNIIIIEIKQNWIFHQRNGILKHFRKQIKAKLNTQS